MYDPTPVTRSFWFLFPKNYSPCFRILCVFFCYLTGGARHGSLCPGRTSPIGSTTFSFLLCSLNNCSYCVLYFRIIAYIVLVLYEPYPIKLLKKSAMVCRSVFSLFYLLPSYVPTCPCVCLSISLPSCYPLTCLFCLLFCFNIPVRSSFHLAVYIHLLASTNFSYVYINSNDVERSLNYNEIYDDDEKQLIASIENDFETALPGSVF